MGGWQGIWVHHRCGKEEILLPAGGDDVIVAQDAIRIPCVDATDLYSWTLCGFVPSRV